MLRLQGREITREKVANEVEQMAIILDHVSYVYEKGTSMEIAALKDINLVIPDGQFIGLIGHTGSGKSTLVQHLNGL